MPPSRSSAMDSNNSDASFATPELVPSKDLRQAINSFIDVSEAIDKQMPAILQAVRDLREKFAADIAARQRFQEMPYTFRDWVNACQKFDRRHMIRMMQAEKEVHYEKLMARTKKDLQSLCKVLGVEVWEVYWQLGDEIVSSRYALELLENTLVSTAVPQKSSKKRKLLEYKKDGGLVGLELSIQDLSRELDVFRLARQQGIGYNRFRRNNANVYALSDVREWADTKSKKALGGAPGTESPAVKGRPSIGDDMLLPATSAAESSHHFQVAQPQSNKAVTQSVDLDKVPGQSKQLSCHRSTSPEIGRRGPAMMEDNSWLMAAGSADSGMDEDETEQSFHMSFPDSEDNDTTNDDNDDNDNHNDATGDSFAAGDNDDTSANIEQTLTLSPKISLTDTPLYCNGVSIREADIRRLDNGRWLNDEIINFAVQDLVVRNGDSLQGLGCASSFFVNQLLQGKDTTKRDGTMLWDQYTTILIPVNSASHWYIVVVDGLKLADLNSINITITVSDSLYSSQIHVVGLLKQSITSWATRRKISIQVSENKTPWKLEQDNHVDCGIYLIENVRRWLFVWRNNDYNFQWPQFRAPEVASLRTEIRKRILAIKEQQGKQLDNGTDFSELAQDEQIELPPASTKSLETRYTTAEHTPLHLPHKKEAIMSLVGDQTKQPDSEHRYEYLDMSLYDALLFFYADMVCFAPEDENRLTWRILQSHLDLVGSRSKMKPPSIPILEAEFEENRDLKLEDIPQPMTSSTDAERERFDNDIMRYKEKLDAWSLYVKRRAIHLDELEQARQNLAMEVVAAEELVSLLEHTIDNTIELEERFYATDSAKSNKLIASQLRYTDNINADTIAEQMSKFGEDRFQAVKKLEASFTMLSYCARNANYLLRRLEKALKLVEDVGNAGNAGMGLRRYSNIAEKKSVAEEDKEGKRRHL